MTQKDYEKFAGLLAGETALARISAQREAKTDQIRCIRLSIADIFAADNPRFDRERFYRACEPQGESKEAK